MSSASVDLGILLNNKVIAVPMLSIVALLIIEERRIYIIIYYTKIKTPRSLQKDDQILTYRSTTSL